MRNFTASKLACSSPLIAFTNYNILQLADSLPRKIVAEKTRINKLRSKKRKAPSGTLSATGSSKKARVEEVEDGGEPSPQAQSSKVCHIHYHHFEAHILTWKVLKTRNPIYLFYVKSDVNAQKNRGNEGDRHYKCCHGEGKILTITKRMKYATNGE